MPTKKSSLSKKSVTNKLTTIGVSIHPANRIEVSIPANIAKAIKCNGTQAYATVVNGVLQITGLEPKVFIPITSLVREDFVANENN